MGKLACVLPRIAPMKAVTGELPAGEAWAFEVKWDGMRVVAAAGDPRRPVRLDTTGGKDGTDRFPELGGLPARLAPHRAILDGEVVAFEDTGRPSFGRLQHRMHLARPSDVAQVPGEIPVCFVVFDLLWLDDEHLTGFPYLDRRRLLTELVAAGCRGSVRGGSGVRRGVGSFWRPSRALMALRDARTI